MLYGWKENSMLTNCLTASTHLSSTVFQLFKLQVQKIAVFTYCSLHFCFPWRRPCDYHAICCMDGKTIQGLPNPSQQVPIYHGLYVCIILYANDILLLAPSVNALQFLLSTCELELRKLDSSAILHLLWRHNTASPDTFSLSKYCPEISCWSVL